MSCPQIYHQPPQTCLSGYRADRRLSMEYDIRELILKEVSRRGQTLCAASKDVAGQAGILSVITSGERALSQKIFDKLVKAWGIHRRPAVFRVWVAAFIYDKMGVEMVPWLRQLDWLPSAGDVQEALEAPAVRVNLGAAVLGSVESVTTRRLKVLHQVAEPHLGGWTTAEVSEAVQEGNGITRTDLGWMRRRGLVSGTKMTEAAVPARTWVVWDVTAEGRQVLTDILRL